MEEYGKLLEIFTYIAGRKCRNSYNGHGRYEDLRTPPSEAKQLYHALKLRKIETVLVEIPDASHGIAARPSNLITKVAHTLAWFEKFK